MELEELKGLIELMNNNNLHELEIEEKGRRIKLKKNLGGQPTVISQNKLPIKEETKEEKKKEVIEIKSPMVGTFYRATSPEVKPYVEVGDEIQPGDIVCIIEAMKSMSEIKAEVKGKIVQIAVENGQPVEFGQPLFIVEAV